MFRLFRSKSEKSKKVDQDVELRRSLKEKLALYEKRSLLPDCDDTDFTDITIEGHRVRVQKNSITIHDVSSNSFLVKRKWRVVT